MLFSPVLEAFSFWVLLRAPQRRLTETYEPEELQDNLGTFKLKIVYIKELLRYMVPLVTVYFCEYFINQGLVSHITSFFQSLSRYPSFHFLFSFTVRIGLF